jgi:hypothetical protein
MNFRVSAAREMTQLNGFLGSNLICNWSVQNSFVAILDAPWQQQLCGTTSRHHFAQTEGAVN